MRFVLNLCLPPIVTVFVRHSAGCKYSTDEFSRRCNCRKHLRWTADGKQHRMAAKARTWDEAEEAKRRLVDQLTGTAAPAPLDNRTVQTCVDTFIKDKAVQGVSADVRGQYKRELARLVAFCSSAGVYSIRALTREVLTDFCAEWTTLYPSAATRHSCRARLNCFLRFCHSCGWVDRRPKLPPMPEPESQTSPLEPGEFDRLMAAADALPTSGQKVNPKMRARVRALLLLQRWSGLSIRDAVTLPKSRLIFDADNGLYRVETARQKTKTPVSVPVPLAVAQELLAVPNSGEYIFWNGKRPVHSLVVSFGHQVRKCFLDAGLDDGQHMKSHRLRDTFAVDLLQKGVPMEDVSRLLGHTSIKTTEKYYAKWAKGRQDRLDSLVVGTWKAPTPGKGKRRLKCFGDQISSRHLGDLIFLVHVVKPNPAIASCQFPDT